MWGFRSGKPRKGKKTIPAATTHFYCTQSRKDTKTITLRLEVSTNAKHYCLGGFVALCAFFFAAPLGLRFIWLSLTAMVRTPGKVGKSTHFVLFQR